MTAQFLLSSEEINESFLAALKALAEGRQIYVTVSNPDKKRIDEAIKNVEQGANLIEFMSAEYELMISQLKAGFSANA